MGWTLKYRLGNTVFVFFYLISGREESDNFSILDLNLEVFLSDVLVSNNVYSLENYRISIIQFDLREKLSRTSNCIADQIRTFFAEEFKVKEFQTNTE